ncbi:MAG TPA: type II toxin-antitoxin system RelE/ParE family toxin [Vitreimonas sp.]|uniref:type II toxin-antitoxin system RelE/ParE family toxin n=1 Tax=Vitreimonas sp. TaxID=3069702 RepID=UPI002D60C1F7|nr:type II toxin-antitoxin system RelE/ParE family toxin [Vitreimonas sp.]HYD86496.1 type II toxin-antitoxin system RelE/ParE family toxin [Vitreimonas sp.]
MIRRSSRARADLIELALFYGERSPAAAYKLLDRIEQGARLLEEHPLVGRLRPELRQDLRSFPVRPLVLFYLPRVDGIEIIRVLHGSRDIGSDMFEDVQ